MKRSRLTWVGIALCCFGMHPLLAQGQKAARPLAGAPEARLPRFESIEQFTQAVRPGTLRGRAEVVGRVGLVPAGAIPLEVLRAGTPAKDGAPWTGALKIHRAENGTV